MYDNLVKKYIGMMTTDNIKDYAAKQNIYLTEQESIIIYNFLNKNYEELLKGNDKILEKLKYELRPEIYQKALILYNDAKNKYL